MSASISAVDFEHFAQAWIDAWNARDLEGILSHYDEDITFVSPNVIRWLGDESGTLRGKSALRAYFAQALAAQSDLRFKLARIYRGVSSLCLEYERHDGRRGAEVMEFSDNGHVARVTAHYAPL
jgi:hypothetical protein